MSEGAEKYEKIVSAARELLAAIDRTIFYDLGTEEEPFPEAEEGLEDRASLDGGGARGCITAGHVRRLRKALAEI